MFAVRLLLKAERPILDLVFNFALGDSFFCCLGLSFYFLLVGVVVLLKNFPFCCLQFVALLITLHCLCDDEFGFQLVDGSGG